MKDKKIIKQVFGDIVSQSKVVEEVDISELERLLLIDNAYGQTILQIRPYKEIQPYEGEVMEQFLHKHGVYVMPTLELILFLAKEINGTAIEIGCGNGAIARTLMIPATDAYVQERPEVVALYQTWGQPTIKYPTDVEKLTAEQAVEKYNPDTVIGAYITHKWNGKTGSAYGVVEGRIVSSGIKYINIGNDNTHKDKPILKHPHKTYRFDWLVTRGEKSKNFIKIWN